MEKPNCLCLLPPLASFSEETRKALTNFFIELQHHCWVYVAEEGRSEPMEDLQGVRFMKRSDTTATCFGDLALILTINSDPTSSISDLATERDCELVTVSFPTEEISDCIDELFCACLRRLAIATSQRSPKFTQSEAA